MAPFYVMQEFRCKVKIPITSFREVAEKSHYAEIIAEGGKHGVH